MRRASARTGRWIAAGTGLGVAVAAVMTGAPASVAATVPAQLALTGVVTGSSPVGGSLIGVHPGDRVDFTAAPAGVSAQGLKSLGIPLGDVLGSLVGQVTGYQVVLHLPTGFPGGRRDVRLGPCGGRSDLKVSFATAGRYTFTWSAYAVTVLPLVGTCTLNTLRLDGNQLAKAGIALNASNHWVGQVVAADDPPAGGLSVQIPAVGARPSVPGVGALPSVGVSGATLPSIPVSPPTLGPPEPAHSPTSSGGPPNGGIAVDYTPHGPSVEDQAVPKGYGGGGSGPTNPGLPGPLSDGSRAVSALEPIGKPFAGAKHVPLRKGQRIDLAATKAPAGRMPVMLAILAIVALSLVTATYARLHLLRRRAS